MNTCLAEYGCYFDKSRGELWDAANGQPELVLKFFDVLYSSYLFDSGGKFCASEKFDARLYEVLCGEEYRLHLRAFGMSSSY